MTSLGDTQLLGYVLYAGAIALISIGLYLVVARDHLIRILLGLTLLESGVNLVLVAAGFRADAVAPILTETVHAGAAMVDPVPQALILTTIVIGIGILALALAVVVQLHRHYGTVSMRLLLGRIEQDQASSGALAHPAAAPTTGPHSSLKDADLEGDLS